MHAERSVCSDLCLRFVDGGMEVSSIPPAEISRARVIVYLSMSMPAFGPSRRPRPNLRARRVLTLCWPRPVTPRHMPSGNNIPGHSPDMPDNLTPRALQDFSPISAAARGPPRCGAGSWEFSSGRNQETKIRTSG